MHRTYISMSALLIFFSVLSCRRNPGLNRIRAGDLSIVYKDTYRGRLEFLGPGREYESLVNRLRGEIEKDGMCLLNVISGEYYTIPHYAYEFKYAACDEANDHLVLRYFARIGEHPLYAGYQIQFVFSLVSGNLLKIFTSEVPLE